MLATRILLIAHKVQLKFELWLPKPNRRTNTIHAFGRLVHGLIYERSGVDDPYRLHRVTAL